jgi:sulfate adenylyltransferase subunit 1 (EFTu-like GTPase family)
MRIEHRIEVNTSRLIGGLQALRFNDIARFGIKPQHLLAIESYASNWATNSFIILDEVTKDRVDAGMIA